MIEAVSTLSVQSSALRASPQSSSSFSVVPAVSSAPNMGFLSIRIDNQVNRAILEYRSGDGEVIQQYPSESQIEAFRRTSELEKRGAESRHAEAAPAESHAQATTVQVQTSAPAPATSESGVSTAPSQSVVV